jgi:hypothetical protein
VAAVAVERDIADALVAIIPLHDGEAALNAGTDRRDRLVEPALQALSGVFRRALCMMPLVIPAAAKASRNFRLSSALSA